MNISVSFFLSVTKNKMNVLNWQDGDGEVMEMDSYNLSPPYSSFTSC